MILKMHFKFFDGLFQVHHRPNMPHPQPALQARKLLQQSGKWKEPSNWCQLLLGQPGEVGGLCWGIR